MKQFKPDHCEFTFGEARALVGQFQCERIAQMKGTFIGLLIGAVAPVAAMLAFDSREVAVLFGGVVGGCMGAMFGNRVGAHFGYRQDNIVAFHNCLVAASNAGDKKSARYMLSQAGEVLSCDPQLKLCPVARTALRQVACSANARS